MRGAVSLLVFGEVRRRLFFWYRELLGLFCQLSLEAGILSCELLLGCSLLLLRVGFAVPSVEHVFFDAELFGGH